MELLILKILLFVRLNISTTPSAMWVSSITSAVSATTATLAAAATATATYIADVLNAATVLNDSLCFCCYSWCISCYG